MIEQSGHGRIYSTSLTSRPVEPFYILWRGLSLPVASWRRTDALLGVFREPHMGGSNAWLLIALPPDKAAHEVLLRQEEKPDWTVHWAPKPCRMVAEWGPNNSTNLRTEISLSCLKGLFEHFGDPVSTHVLWLTKSLRPRLTGASLRTSNDLHQVFLRL